ncbi:MAG: hypothetical protein IRZ10_10360 [Thermoflavifilum sp.]|nr:hypothetical protein [Thermoflavifilum sp.]MCL6514811.1 hypothetical protein [Alicyclobacillus sp.]
MAEQVLTVVVNALMGVLAMALSTGAVYAARWLRAHVGAQKLALLMTVARIVVNAVEQAAAAGILKLPKREAAVARLRNWAARGGVQLTDEQIDDLIEYAVKAMKDAGLELKGAAQNSNEDPQAKVEAAKQRLAEAEARYQAAQADVEAAKAALEQAEKEAAASNGGQV